MSQIVAFLMQYSNMTLLKCAVVIAVGICSCPVNSAWAGDVWHCKLSADQMPIEQDFEVQKNVVLRSADDYSNSRLPFDLIENSAIGLVAVHHDGSSVVLFTVNKLNGLAKEIGTDLSRKFVDVWNGTCTLR